MERPFKRNKRSIVIDSVILWTIVVLAYGVVGFLRGHQLIRSGWRRLRPSRDWPA